MISPLKGLNASDIALQKQYIWLTFYVYRMFDLGLLLFNKLFKGQYFISNFGNCDGYFAFIRRFSVTKKKRNIESHMI